MARKGLAEVRYRICGNGLVYKAIFCKCVAAKGFRARVKSPPTGSECPLDSRSLDCARDMWSLPIRVGAGGASPPRRAGSCRGARGRGWRRGSFQLFGRKAGTKGRRTCVFRGFGKLVREAGIALIKGDNSTGVLRVQYGGVVQERLERRPDGGELKEGAALLRLGGLYVHSHH